MKQSRVDVTLTGVVVMQRFELMAGCVVTLQQ